MARRVRPISRVSQTTRDPVSAYHTRMGILNLTQQETRNLASSRLALHPRLERPIQLLMAVAEPTLGLGTPKMQAEVNTVMTLMKSWMMSKMS